MRPRRFLPSLSLLLAFEAVLRHGSVTAAARELSLTQGTVSRLLASLEGQLGQTLFLRERRRLIPTEAALHYGAEVTRALDLLQRASTRIATGAEGGALALAVLPTFATRWLAPRLGGFLQANPGVTVNLATRTARFSFQSEPYDAVIFFGAADWPGARHQKLFDERLTACAAPALLARHPVQAPADLAGLTLLQMETRPGAWPAWFRGQGVDPPAHARTGMLLDQFALMIETAISGLGVALLPDYMARAEIAEGRLAPVLRPAVPGAGAYWLAWPEAKESHRPLAAFRTWIAGQGR
ncbi:MAG: LysR family transcriptional regulator [Rhodobacterales bacterium]|nr:LysR family transcriptional regulator [Rhodobacterales bacterium]